jgi:hypothetical protein
VAVEAVLDQLIQQETVVLAVVTILDIQVQALQDKATLVVVVRAQEMELVAVEALALLVELGIVQFQETVEQEQLTRYKRLLLAKIVEEHIMFAVEEVELVEVVFHQMHLVV